MNVAAQSKKIIAELKSQFRECNLSVTSVHELIPLKEGVADDPAKLLLWGEGGEAIAVLIWSPPAAPNIVERGAVRASAAAMRLGRDLNAVVIEPLQCGELDGRSYVILPLERPLNSNRWIWRAQRYWLAPRILSWLQHAVVQTQREIPDAEIRDKVGLPLETVIADPLLSASLRARAERALSRLHDERWSPRSALCHNDLWSGNVLLPRSAESRRRAGFGFYLIDWAGAEIDGFPIWDLLRVATSFSVPRFWLRRQLIRHCALLGCDESDAGSYLAAAVGQLALHRGCMPDSVYSEASEMMNQKLGTTLA